MTHIKKIAIVLSLLLTITSAEAAKQKKRIKGPKLAKTEVSCMAQNILHEAGGESYLGQKAVAAVTMNRVLSHKFPKTVCGVVYQRGQFAWVGKRSNKQVPERIQEIAHQYVNSYTKELDVTNGSTYFNSSKNSKWKLNKIMKIGGHTFYKGHNDFIVYTTPMNDEPLS
jgi:N-acetylmuramoyl-L-alanine amidase